MPASESTQVPVTTRIGLALSDSVLMESVNATTFKINKLGDNTPIQGIYSVNLGFVHFTPSQNLSTNQIYVVTIDGIQDFAENGMPYKQYLFSTGNIASHNATVSIPSTTQVGQSISVSASTSPIDGGALEYSWSFGDGTPLLRFLQTPRQATYIHHWVIGPQLLPCGSLTSVPQNLGSSPLTTRRHQHLLQRRQPLPNLAVVLL